MRYTNILCGSVAACLSWAAVWSTAAYADLGDQLFKLLPDDGTADDRFGSSVAINGTTAIVGAKFGDDYNGSAYLFDLSDLKNPVQIARLLANDGAVGDRFGISVAISDPPGKEVAIVGASRDDDNGNLSGSAYLFDTTTGQQIAKLLPDDGAADDRFGLSVAISGTTAIIGALRDDDNGSLSGSAYLFDTTTGTQIAKLLPKDGAANDLFGVSVAICGTTAIVGALREDNNNGIESGSAYVFDISDPNNPVQTAKLLPDDGAAEDWFGNSVAISGDPGKEIVIVGAFRDDDNGSDSGSAYLFDVKDRNNPVQIAKLLPSDGAEGDFFGGSVSISGPPGEEIAVVGAISDDENGFQSGSAYLFDTSTGTQIAKLLSDDGEEFNWFGNSVAINGHTAIVGAFGDDDNGIASGSAYLFDAAGAPGKCPWDLDDNAVVGVSDLLSLLASWGRCKGCPADFDGNDDVGVSDLLLLLANWGPCP